MEMLIVSVSKLKIPKFEPNGVINKKLTVSGFNNASVGKYLHIRPYNLAFNGRNGSLNFRRFPQIGN